jgi:hypothetical protein
MTPAQLIAAAREDLRLRDAIGKPRALELIAALEAMQAESADLKASVVAFCGPWAVQYAEAFALPKGHIHPTHYDILKNAGARMDDFTRHEPQAPEAAQEADHG